ncbi:hypothetical protein Tco_1053168, partial [Tanacetum coccineum]
SSVITHNAAYQADDQDTYDSDCNDNALMNQSVHEMSYSEHTNLVEQPEHEITSDSNIIPYS